MEEFYYDAFISYSHRDMDSARALQRRLETFAVPRAMGEGIGGRRRLRVFRDQTDLAGVELQNALHRELSSSRYLIVLCSPNSAASHWVSEEIRYFISLAGAERVIPFIVSGEPESDDPALECYPEALRSQSGHIPLGANIQEIGKSKAFLKVVSVLLGVRFNRLVDRERQRRRRRALIGGGTAAVIAAVIAALLWRNSVISRQNQELSYDIYGAAIVSIAQKDEVESADVAFLQTSAEAGNTRAILLLADCLLHGRGVEADPEAAFGWYLQAAEAGDATAMIAVANCYHDGTGTDADLAESHAWNLRAARAGEPAGMLNVAIDLEDGLGVEADPEKAFDWYERAAESGYDLGMYNLSRCYLAGVGTRQNPEKAFYWTGQLAQTGNPMGMYNLALMYQYGYGTAEDPRQAYEWYRAAADVGDSDGMYMVGWCLENGYGVGDDALEWYLRAAEAGNEQAAEAVARLTN